jgi:hypothetical protein
MAQYRCYFLDGAGAIRGVETVIGVDDDRALDAARDLLARRPAFAGFELWRGERRVYVEAMAVP